MFYCAHTTHAKNLDAAAPRSWTRGERKAQNKRPGARQKCLFSSVRVRTGYAAGLLGAETRQRHTRPRPGVSCLSHGAVALALSLSLAHTF